MFGKHTIRKYKVAHARDRIRFTPDEVLQLKKQVTGHVETKTVLGVHDLKVIQEQNEKQIQLVEGEVTDIDMDKSTVVPVYDKVTGERMLIGPKEPHPIYYQEHAQSGITIKCFRKMCLIISILLLLMNVYFVSMWIYSDHYFPLEFFREQFILKGSIFNRLVLNFQMNLYLGLLSFLYALWGISISTVFTKPVMVSAFFTWSVPFIFPYLMFASFQIVNLSSIDAAQLKSILQHALWKFGYDKANVVGRYAWHQAQYTLKCCGVDGYKDWHVADWGYWINRTDKPSLDVDLQRFPESCCPNYTLAHEDGYILRTRNYAIQMLYCQYYPNQERLSEGCFSKLILFFQSFTEQLIILAMCKIGLMVLAATFAFMAHTRYKRHSKPDHNYKYTCRDWMVDFCCIRYCKWVKDARKKRVGPPLLNLGYDDRPMDQNILERRRPHLIDKLRHRRRVLEQNEEEVSLDEEARLDVAGLIKEPVIQIIDEHNEHELFSRKKTRHSRNSTGRKTRMDSNNSVDKKTRKDSNKSTGKKKGSVGRDKDKAAEQQDDEKVKPQKESHIDEDKIKENQLKTAAEENGTENS